MAEAALISGEARPMVSLRWCARAALALIGAALLWHAAALVRFALDAINYPYELDYGEGIVWQQMRLMFTNQAYGSIDGFPAIVFHYPPIYHSLSQALAALAGMDGLAAGRSLSLAALLAAASLGGVMAFRLSRPDGRLHVALVSSVVAAFAMLTNWPVLFWTPVMRVDFLALAFSFGGAWFAMLTLERPRMIYAAAVAFVLAVYTKHSMIAAPAGCFGALLLLRPRLAIGGAGAAVALGLASLALLLWLTEGGFVRHLFLYNINRFDLRQMRPLAELLLTHSLYFIAAALALRSRVPALLAAVRARQLRGGDEAWLVFLGYFAATLAMLPLMAKSGSNINYLIEFMCLVAILAGIAAGDAARLVFGERAPSSALAMLVLVGLAAQVSILPDSRYDRIPARPKEAELDRLSAMIRAAEKPVISDEMVLLIRSGKDVVWEPAIFAELASIGRYDEPAFAGRIGRREFGFFVTYRERGDVVFDSRYNSAVAEAIDRAYPDKRSLGHYTIHLPPR